MQELLTSNDRAMNELQKLSLIKLDLLKKDLLYKNVNLTTSIFKYYRTRGTIKNPHFCTLLVVKKKKQKRNM